MTRRNFRRILTALLLTGFLAPSATAAPSGQLALIPNPSTEVKELILEAFLFPDDYRERIAEYCSNLVGLPTGTPVPLSALKLKPSTPQSRTFKTDYENLIKAPNPQQGRPSGADPKVASDWPQLSGMLRQAAKGKGNFGIGTATREQADAIGRAWVGEGAKLSSDGKALISKNGLRQYRFPQEKPNSPYATTGVQANLEARNEPKGQWQSNAHIDITG